jgi:hypothetical protein
MLASILLRSDKLCLKKILIVWSISINFFNSIVVQSIIDTFQSIWCSDLCKFLNYREIILDIMTSSSCNPLCVKRAEINNTNGLFMCRGMFLLCIRISLKAVDSVFFRMSAKLLFRSHNRASSWFTQWFRRSY